MITVIFLFCSLCFLIFFSHLDYDISVDVVVAEMFIEKAHSFTQGRIFILILSNFW